MVPTLPPFCDPPVWAAATSFQWLPEHWLGEFSGPPNVVAMEEAPVTSGLCKKPGVEKREVMTKAVRREHFTLVQKVAARVRFAGLCLSGSTPGHCCSHRDFSLFCVHCSYVGLQSASLSLCSSLL